MVQWQSSLALESSQNGLLFQVSKITYCTSLTQVFTDGYLVEQLFFLYLNHSLKGSLVGKNAYKLTAGS